MSIGSSLLIARRLLAVHVWIGLRAGGERLHWLLLTVLRIVRIHVHVRVASVLSVQERALNRDGQRDKVNNARDEGDHAQHYHGDVQGQVGVRGARVAEYGTV